MAKLSAIVVSHHDQFRRDLAQLAELVDKCVDVVSEVSTFHEALDQVAGLRPEVVLLDLGLRDGSALELTRCIRTQWPETDVILVGHEPVSDYRRIALEAGAKQYIDLLEVGTQLPSALLLVEHPPECGSGQHDATSESTESLLVVNLRTRMRTAPTGPKHGLFTSWQYVHIVLAIILTAILIKNPFAAGMSSERLLLLTAALVGICVIEIRQFGRARQAATTPDPADWKGGAIVN